MRNHAHLKERHVVVLVLGDIGRSPRMQNQSVSIASLLYDKRAPNRCNVTLIGYKGEQCIPSVIDQPNLRILPITPILSHIPRSLFLLTAPIKVLLQILQLFYILLVSTGNTDAILLQNPPTIPTFLVVWISCKLKRAKFIIDWHNFGYTILALSLGISHVFVRIARFIERVIGQKADANFCVTQSMQTYLLSNWNIHATVLYDKPPISFRPTPLELRHKLFQSLSGQLKLCNDLVSWEHDADTLEMTLVTRKVVHHDGIRHTFRHDRPAVVISSTSWTPDEDFGILFNALILLDQRIASSSSFPNLLVFVTGKGPQKAHYVEKINHLRLRRIRIATLWMQPEEYPLLLGAADLGVCLHTSSSGLDLPMKIIDMFGCQVPVCAVGFESLSELVQHSKNGMIFSTHLELVDQLFELLDGFPSRLNGKLHRMRMELQSIERWTEHWNTIAKPVITALWT